MVNYRLKTTDGQLMWQQENMVLRWRVQQTSSLCSLVWYFTSIWKVSKPRYIDSDENSTLKNSIYTYPGR